MPAAISITGTEYGDIDILWTKQHTPSYSNKKQQQYPHCYGKGTKINTKNKPLTSFSSIETTKFGIM